MLSQVWVEHMKEKLASLNMLSIQQCRLSGDMKILKQILPPSSPCHQASNSHHKTPQLYDHMVLCKVGVNMSCVVNSSPSVSLSWFLKNPILIGIPSKRKDSNVISLLCTILYILYFQKIISQGLVGWGGGGGWGIRMKWV